MHEAPINTGLRHIAGLKPRGTTSARHAMRVLRTLQVWSAAVFWVPLLFAIVFALRREWYPAAYELPMVLLGVAGWLLCRRGKLQAAAAVLGIGMLVALWLLAALMDIPSPRAPRTVHHYFMVLGVGMMLMFRNGNRLLSLVIPMASLGSAVFFSASTWGIETPFAVSDDVREKGAWIHTGFALAMVLALMWAMQSDFSGQRALMRDLKKALAGGQLELYFQPQVHVSGRVVGAEALLRWRHPELGMVSPGEFIPLAEKSGLIVPIGDWVLDRACRQLALWAEMPALAPLVLAINVSAGQFRQADFVAGVVAALERHGVEPNRLKLELTESMLADDLDDMVRKMAQLKGWGVGPSLDDFGTGYSSLGYLKRLPLDQVKIDASFVRDILTNAHDAAIARTVVTLARELQLDVMAEGVEEAGQRDFLRDIGCLTYQGYLFSRPLPRAKFEAMIRESRVMSRSGWSQMLLESKLQSQPA